MSRAIVSTRAFRRRIPSETAVRLWIWDPRPRRKDGSNRAWRWMPLVVAGVLALVVFQVVGGRAPAAPKEDEILWLETPPEPPSEPPRTESVVAPPPPEPVALPVAPVPPPDPTPAVDPDPDPAFGLDDAVETGGLAVATGQTLARAAEEVVRPPVETPPGPLMLSGVPGTTNPVVPRYPPRAEAMGLEASVVALVTTDTSGNVVGFRIEKSGGREFDESVRRAALSTRFTVPRREGRAQAVAFRMPYSFRLE